METADLMNDDEQNRDHVRDVEGQRVEGQNSKEGGCAADVDELEKDVDRRD